MCQALDHVRVARQVIHAQGNHSQGTGHQLVRVRTLAAMGAHVVHLAVVARLEPPLQVFFVLAKLQAGNANLLEAQFATPVFDRLGQGGEIGGKSRHAKKETGA
ncbi:hypothetical protein D3C86_1862330 [compost metagenome]